jgi:hypothetical protein
MLDHLQACSYCPKSNPETRESRAVECTVYEVTTWVNRRGGCPMFPYRDLPPSLTYIDGVIHGRGRVGQQKQKHEDRKYKSKNDGRLKYRSGNA